MKTGSNIRLRKDGRYEARYIKTRDHQGKIIYGYCYGQSYEEAEAKRNQHTQKELIPRELRLLILGAGCHGEAIMELAQQLRVFQEIKFLDDYLTGPDIIGKCSQLEQYLDHYCVAFPAIADPTIRIRWTNELIKAGFFIPALVHPAAVVSAHAKIGVGTVVYARATIGTGAVIGKSCIISSGSTIDRNADLPDWSYVDCGESINAQGIRIRRA